MPTFGRLISALSLALVAYLAADQIRAVLPDSIPARQLLPESVILALGLGCHTFGAAAWAWMDELDQCRVNRRGTADLLGVVIIFGQQSLETVLSEDLPRSMGCSERCVGRIP